MNKLIFLVGFPRSGTTLVATKLAMLPSVAVTPETRYFAEVVEERMVFNPSVSAEELASELEGSVRLSDLNMNIRDIVETSGRTHFNRFDFFSTLMENFAQAHRAQIVIEKSPVHTYYVLDLLKRFPKSKVIGIRRDGRDALLSLKNTPWAKETTQHYACDWVYRNALLDKAAEEFPDRVHIFSFESFVENMDDHLQDIAKWIGVTGQVSSESKSDVLTIPEWEQKWKSKAAERPDMSRVAVWKSHEDDQAIREFTAIAGSALQKWGYESSNTTPRGLIVLRLYPVVRGLKRMVRKILILAGQADRISSQRGLEKLL